MRNQWWEPAHRLVCLDHLTQADGRGDVVTGTRAELLRICRDRNIPRKAITPYTSRFGYGYTIQRDVPGAREDRRNKVALLLEDGTTATFAIRAGCTAYQTQMDLTRYEAMLRLVERDYPAGSLTAELAATLAQLVQAYTAAKDEGQHHLDLALVDQIVSARLNNFARAWTQDDDEDE